MSPAATDFIRLTRCAAQRMADLLPISICSTSAWSRSLQAIPCSPTAAGSRIAIGLYADPPQIECIYCGGTQPADTIEHMPPVMMFIRKQRPKGLEFPSCRECNNGTSKSDLVASLLGRLSVEPAADVEAAEFKKLLCSVRNNVPRLLEEMHISRAGQNLLRESLSLQEGGGVLRANGPLAASSRRSASR